MCHLSTKFGESQSSSFCVILFTKKQTNADEMQPVLYVPYYYFMFKLFSHLATISQ